MKELLLAQRLSQYVTLYPHTVEPIRAIDPQAGIWAVAACNPQAPFIPDFLEEMKKRGKLHLTNEITYRAYSVHPEDHYPGVDEWRRTVARFSDRITIRQGQSGVPVSPAPGSRAEQAAVDGIQAAEVVPPAHAR